MSSARDFGVFTMYCSEKDFSRTIRRTQKIFSLPTSKCRRNYGSNFVVSVSFLIGLSLGIPLTFLALHLCDLHQEKSFTRRETLPNSTAVEDHERIIGVDVTKSSYLNSFSDVSVPKPVVVPRTDIALGKHVNLRSSYNANSNTLSNSMLVGLKEHRPRPIIPTLERNQHPHLDIRPSLLSGSSENHESKHHTLSPLPTASAEAKLIFSPAIKNNNSLIHIPDSKEVYDIIMPSPFTNISSSITTKNSTLELSNIVNGVYWTSYAESLVPKGFDDVDIQAYRRFLNATQILKIEEGCGRMQNRLVIFDGGNKSCCRYRHNNDQIQGEIFSFYLGKILGLKNLSPSALALANPRDHRWFSAAPQVALAQWSSERPLVLTKFIEDLRPAYIPKHFQIKNRTRLHPIAQDLLDQDFSNLVQWSDLIIFDYLTANLDRTINNMYNERWNRDMMRQPAHNLATTPEGLLLFLDNESGLLHGYRLLEKYEHFHRSLLNGLCVFRHSTVTAIKRLHEDSNVGSLLRKAFLNGEPGMSEWLAFLPEKNVRTLKERISTVYNHIQNCELKFKPMRTTSSMPVSGTPHR